MEADGVDEKEVLYTPLTMEDLQKAFEIIEIERKEVLSLLGSNRLDFPESSPDDH